MRLHQTANAFLNQRDIGQNFFEYWMNHCTPSGQDRNASIADEDKLMEQIFVDRDGTISTGHSIQLIDEIITELPFKFGRVGSFRIDMPRLNSMKGMPKECGHFGIESFGQRTVMMNHHITSLVGCPQKCQHIAFEIGAPLESLKTSLTSPIESMWIQTPEVKSFAGFNSQCAELTINMTAQQSITGIHKQLTGVDNLFLVLPREFKGGLLGLAMIPNVKYVASGGIVTRPMEAINEIGKMMRQKMNVHDIQEQLMESGYREFARL